MQNDFLSLECEKDCLVLVSQREPTCFWANTKTLVDLQLHDFVSTKAHSLCKAKRTC